MKVQDVIDLILSRKGTTFVSFTSDTAPKLKVGCPFHGVRKHCHVNGVIGYNYENSVNLQRIREGEAADFVAEPRKWGTRLIRDGKATPIVLHDGKVYLTIKVERSLGKPVYMDAQGMVIPVEVLSAFLPKKYPTRQGLDKEIVPRDFQIDNVKTLTIAGQTISIEA